MAAAACTTLYWEGGDDEVTVEQALELVEAGTITDETQVYSDEPGFPFEGWTDWAYCAYLFGVGEQPETVCTTL